MFFVNAKELGENFFTRSEPNMPFLDLCDINDEYRDNESSLRTYEFGQWILKTVIPLFNSANHGRKIGSSNNRARAMRRVTLNDSIHRDHSCNRNLTFVTLSPTKGTLFPIRTGYENQRTPNIPKELLRRDFAVAPPRYAAIFDPDTEWHAEPPMTGSLVYRGELFVNIEPNEPMPERVGIKCPDSPLCIDPLTY